MNVMLSVVIPVLNEEKVIPRLLEDIEYCRNVCEFSIETIIVDGGSTDNTVAICKKYDTKVFSSPPGRGQQLALGAQQAAGQNLLFLHADSRLSPEHCQTVIAALNEELVAAGGFQLHFNDSHWILKLAERVNKIRFSITRIIYGDHGLFVSRKTYFKVGGFSDIPLFEDIEFSKKVKKLGEVRLYSPSMVTSSRRFKSGGVLRTYLKMAFLHVAFWVGVPATTLSRWYEKGNFR